MSTRNPKTRNELIQMLKMNKFTGQKEESKEEVLIRPSKCKKYQRDTQGKAGRAA